MTVENANSKITVWTSVVVLLLLLLFFSYLFFFSMREKTAALNAKTFVRF